ncbi:hypothetical protein B0I37DRAFT_370379 [Chaetomium sp. MPI-CAGE-AT-0009]|nr:hypothetical protein B0I37DRAFT_370379 [Chaetomium sp. MPI-CAGE-AT-0009]
MPACLLICRSACLPCELSWLLGVDRVGTGYVLPCSLGMRLSPSWGGVFSTSLLVGLQVSIPVVFGMVGRFPVARLGGSCREVLGGWVSYCSWFVVAWSWAWTWDLAARMGLSCLSVILCG